MALTEADRAEVASQPTWEHVAISGDQIFVRELEAIAAYRWRVGDSAETTASP